MEGNNRLSHSLREWQLASRSDATVVATLAIYEERERERKEKKEKRDFGREGGQE